MNDTNTFMTDIVENLDMAVGIVDIPKPSIVRFKGSNEAMIMIAKHIRNRSKIKIHADIDFDGIAATFIVRTFLTDCGLGATTRPCINKEKVHGMSEKHIDFINKSGINLFIIVDSSTNDIDIIKKFNCDVLVLDHHEILHTELMGKTAGGSYIIINNMADNIEEGFKADENMSGAMVSYEFLRLFEQEYLKYSIVERRMLYQWAGISLLSDAIKTSKNRCMWYMHNTINNTNLEPTIGILLSILSRYDKILDKSFINYTLVPLFNKAIRAGKSSEALSVALNHPDKADMLKPYADIQNKLKELALDHVEESSNIMYRNLTDENIHENYAGFLAQEILNKTNKSAFTYIETPEILEGHFRGKRKHLDYRKLVADTGLFAQGHKTAFGCKIPKERLPEIFKLLSHEEKEYKEPIYLTLGSIRSDLRGVHHIENMDEFKKQGLLWKLAMLNSHLTSDESINILTTKENIEKVSQRGKMWLYDVHGLECKAFEEITSHFVSIYVEYGKQLNGYVHPEVGII